MLVVLAGQTASGKDSIARSLISDYGYKRVVSHTTRPMRVDEKEGVDYYYHKSINEAKNKFNTKTYHTVSGDWHYWFEYEDIKSAIESDETYLTIADVDGALALSDVGANIIYIYVPLDIRMKRYYERESKNKNPDYKEVLRRLISDSKDFKEFEEAAISDNVYNYVCNYKHSIEKTVDMVDRHIKNELINSFTG